jgi:uncharacterized membrane protein YfcA
MELPLASWIVGLTAAFLVGFSKTGVPGLGILIVPMLAVVFPGKMSVGALLPMLIVGDIMAIIRYRRHAQWSKLWRLFPFVALGMLPAALLLTRIPERPFKLLLGILVLLLISLELLRRRYKWEKMPKSILFIAFMGVLGGFATTMGNAAGPIMSVYLLSMGLKKKEFIGTNAWYFFIVNATKIPIFLRVGDMITPETLRFNLYGVPLIILGALLGYLALPRIPQKLFTGLVFSLGSVAALVLIWSVLR